MTLEALDRQQLPSRGTEHLTDSSLRPLLRRRSVPTLWFSWRKLPALYSRDRTARYDLSVTHLLVRMLMYTTSHDQHSALDDLCDLRIDRESLERFAHVLLKQWLSGPRTPQMSWVIHSQRVTGGLSSLMEMSELLINEVPEQDDVLRNMLDVFWQHELLGPSFLYLLEHHPEERVTALVREFLSRTRDREMWHDTSPSKLEEMLHGLCTELHVMALSEGMREIMVDDVRLELRMTNSGWLEARAPDRSRYRISAEQAFAATHTHREVWLLIDLFRHIALRWRGMVHAANAQQHRFSQPRWRELFFSGQVVSQWSCGMVWAEYDEHHELLGTFRVTEDGSLVHVDDESYRLADQSQISLAHASLIGAAMMDSWGAHLADYEIISPISQFEQHACDEWDREALEDFILEGCHERRVDRDALERNVWRPFDLHYFLYYRKKIFVGKRRLFLGLELDVGTHQVTRASVIESHTSLVSQVSPPTMPLRDLDETELRVVVEQLLAVLR